MRSLREMSLALVAALAMTAAGHTAFLRSAETATLDLRFRLRGPRPASPDLAVVLADDASLAELGRWAFPRSDFIRAIDLACAGGARLIVFDLLFAEKEDSMPAAFRMLAAKAAAMAKDRDLSLAGALQALATTDPDRNFATAIRSAGNVLLPVAFGFGAAPATPPAELLPSAFKASLLVAPGFNYAGRGWDFGVELLLPATSSAGRGVGFVAQLHLSLDYLLPATIGHPVF